MKRTAKRVVHEKLLTNLIKIVLSDVAFALEGRAFGDGWTIAAAGPCVRVISHARLDGPPGCAFLT